MGVERADSNDPLDVMDWVTLYALAVNEENAARTNSRTDRRRRHNTRRFELPHEIFRDCKC